LFLVLVLQPLAPAANDVRSAVQHLVQDASQLPDMPGFIDHRPLLGDLQQWVDALQGCQADLQAARQAAEQGSTDSAAQLSAADEEADPEGWHRLAWLRWDEG
jgi:hypothetical protein